MNQSKQHIMKPNALQKARTAFMRAVAALIAALTVVQPIAAYAANTLVWHGTSHTDVPAANCIIVVEDWRKPTKVDVNNLTEGTNYKFNKNDSYVDGAGKTRTGWNFIALRNTSGMGSNGSSWSIPGTIKLTYEDGVMARKSEDGTVTYYDLEITITNIKGAWRKTGGTVPSDANTYWYGLIWMSKDAFGIGGLRESIFPNSTVSNKKWTATSYSKFPNPGFSCKVTAQAKTKAGNALLYNLAFQDIDQPDLVASTASDPEWNGTYTEDICLDSTFKDVYADKDCILAHNSASYNYIWAQGTDSGDNSSWKTGFVAQTKFNFTFWTYASGSAFTYVFNDYSYQVTTEASEHGTVTPSFEAIPKQKYTVTATPDPGYYCSSFKVDGKEQKNKSSYTWPSVTGDHTVTVEFKPYTLSIQYDAEGGTVGNSTYSVGSDDIIMKGSTVFWTTTDASNASWTGHVDLANSRGGGFKLTKAGYYLPTGAEWVDANGTTYSQEETAGPSGSTLAKLTGSTSTVGKVEYLTTNKTLTLYANWKPYTLTVQHNANGGTVGNSSYYADNSGLLRNASGGSIWTATTDITQASWSDTSSPLKLAASRDSGFKLTKTGYHLNPGSEWNTAANGSGTSYRQGYGDVKPLSNGAIASTGKNLSGTNALTSDKTVTLYADWKPNVYNIVYDLKGGTHGTSHPDQATYDETFIVSEPTRDDYTFLGWSIDYMDSTAHVVAGIATNETWAEVPAGSNTSYKNLTSVNGATIEFTAKWLPKTLTIYRQWVTDGLPQEVVDSLPSLSSIEGAPGETVTIEKVGAIEAQLERTLPGGSVVTYDTGYLPRGWYVDDPTLSPENLVVAGQDDARLDQSFTIPDEWEGEHVLYVWLDPALIDGVMSQ